ncbi:MAG: thymidylate kinase [Rickettsiales bacterium]|jgi:thymidylate kinase|nr:thymidylate kinase [Rickettsiales bacterium]
MFIDIEGGNASGKSTIIKCLVENLKNEGKKVIHLKSPTFPFDKMWQNINDCDLLTKYYFFRAIAQNDSEKIKRLKNEYDFVILERYLYETEAFDLTIEKLNGETTNLISKHINYSDLLKPDYVFFLDISDEERIKRIKERGNDIDICYWEKIEFQKIYNEFYRKIAMREKFIVIDAEKEIPERCVDKICEFIFTHYIS